MITGAVREISQTAIKANWMAKAKIFRVTISLDKTVPEIMKPGMSAQASAIVSETPSQLVIPRSAVAYDHAEAKAIRMESENARRAVTVTILGADGLHFLVANNGALKEGDRVLSKFPMEGGQSR
jgi:multidrug efflux pump subunit AcrA (membrane-fusion protein)